MQEFSSCLAITHEDISAALILSKNAPLYYALVLASGTMKIPP